MGLGKPNRSVLSKTVWKLTGARSPDVMSGPSLGVDVSVLKLGNGQVMLANCDPISLLPSLGPEDSAKMSVFEVASDVATTGHSPRYAMFDLNLPAKMSDRTLAEYWGAIDKACKELGVTILGGHTGRFEGCDYSIVGGATMWATSEMSGYLTSDMAMAGDDLIVTKTAGYGATAVLSRAFPKTVRKHLGNSEFQNASKYFSRTNTVNDSLVAVRAGIHSRGVTAMHDVTEGGVLAAIWEMANASKLGGTIDMETIPLSEETVLLSKLFGIDPLTSLGEGSLLIASRPNRTAQVLKTLNSNRILATVVGSLSSKNAQIVMKTKSGSHPLRYPKSDPYWRAYWKAVRKGWA